MRTARVWIVLTACLLAGVGRADELQVLGEEMAGGEPADMMNRHLRGLADLEFAKWKQRYEQVKTPDQIAEYQQRLRSCFLDALGRWPRRTPLNAQVTGVVRRQGYRVEKVLFESQPQFYVTALLFVPESERFAAPYPGVLVPCGHAREAKGYESYQTMGALLALNGMVALVFDPIDQGERGQMMSQWPGLWGVQGHTMTGVGSILVGRNTAWFEIWDGMRGIDYLQSRPDVDGERIGCTGNSGGGTQTSYLMALDDRIDAAAPSCYITNFYERILDLGAQDAEQNIYGQLAFGMDHADYLMMRAPSAIMICAATQDFFDIRGTWQSFRYAKRLYSRLGFAERIDILENDAPHNYNELQRQSVVRWMARWLQGRDEAIVEPQVKLLDANEFQVTAEGQVMKMEGARSTYDQNRAFERRLGRQRRQLWSEKGRAEMMGDVRRIAGIRPLGEIAEPNVAKVGTIERAGLRIEKLVIVPTQGVFLPALKYVPAGGGSKEAVLYVHEAGKAADAGADGPIEKLAAEGKTVLAVDLRGTGETQQTKQNYFKPYSGGDGQDAYTAYLLGKSYVGMRAEDVLLCGRLLKAEGAGRISLAAVGNVTVPALHAAAVEPELFHAVTLKRGLVSWKSVIESGMNMNQLVNTVHGALTAYDLPDLRAALGDRLRVEEPLNAMGEPVEQ